MNHYCDSVFRWLVVSFVLVVLASPGFCQNTLWAGQVQCQLSVQANGYTHQETQTWAISGAPTASGAIEVYPSSWSSNGRGAVQQPARTAQWTVNVQPTNAPLAIFIRSSDNRLVIKSYHSQIYSPAGITGNQILPTQGSLQFPANEWALPVIEDSPTSLNVSGSATVAIAPSLLPLQTSSSQVSTANCNWQFSKTSGGLPQPVLAAKSVAMPTAMSTNTTTTASVASLTAPTSKFVGLILGRSSDGAVCPQLNPVPATSPGLSHAYASFCTIKFSDSQWTSVASWTFPADRYLFFVTVQPLDHSGNSGGGTSPPSYTCNLAEPNSVSVSILDSSVSGVGSQKDTIVGIPHNSVSAVELRCGTFSGVTYNAVATVLAIQIGAIN